MDSCAVQVAGWVADQRREGLTSVETRKGVNQSLIAVFVQLEYDTAPISVQATAITAESGNALEVCANGNQSGPWLVAIPVRGSKAVDHCLDAGAVYFIYGSESQAAARHSSTQDVARGIL